MAPAEVKVLCSSAEGVKSRSKEGMISAQCMTQAVSGGFAPFTPAVVMRRPRRWSVVVAKARPGGVAARVLAEVGRVEIQRFMVS